MCYTDKLKKETFAVFNDLIFAIVDSKVCKPVSTKVKMCIRDSGYGFGFG